MRAGRTPGAREAVEVCSRIPACRPLWPALILAAVPLLAGPVRAARRGFWRFGGGAGAALLSASVLLTSQERPSAG